ncbi:MAG: peptidase [Rhizobiales bacterium NRL2]|jgi:murein DD-endopeptidase MepM/ murein hydrolase activator NlpD|nr:MAG: peptidase [Rhizobiales bacterium NRL2]
MRSVLAFFLLCLSLPAAAYEISGNAVQGGMLTGRTEPGTEVLLNGEPIRVSPDGRFVLGFGRDHDGTAELRVGDSVATLVVGKRDYDIQRIDGLPEKMVTPDAEALKRIRREAAEIAEVRAIDTSETFFTQAWRWPTVGIVSGVFGSQRVLNGEPRRPHFGIDIAADTGTAVHAPTDAIVRLAAPDLYFTGGTVMLDHGHGVTSVYSHLSSIGVEVGQRVAQGEKIAEVGSTGRSTGPHLDWRVNWFAERLDPALLAGPMPEKP